MMKFFETSRGQALTILAGVSGAAGPSLTLAPMFESPPPFTIFEFDALVAGSLGLVVMRRKAVTPVPMRVVAQSPATLDGNAAAGTDSAATATVHVSVVHAYPSERIPSEGVRYEGANHIGLGEWLLAPTPTKDQDCDNVA